MPFRAESLSSASAEPTDACERSRRAQPNQKLRRITRREREEEKTEDWRAIFYSHASLSSFFLPTATERGFSLVCCRRLCQRRHLLLACLASQMLCCRSLVKRRKTLGRKLTAAGSQRSVALTCDFRVCLVLRARSSGLVCVCVYMRERERERERECFSCLCCVCACVLYACVQCVCVATERKDLSCVSTILVVSLMR